MNRFLLFTTLVALIIVACGSKSNSETAATSPPTLTNAPAFTDTVKPTNTPPPDPTITPTIRNTLEPTGTPTPISAFTATREITLTPTTSGNIVGNVIIINVNKNAEYVDLKNNGNGPQDLRGWVLVSERGNQRCVLSGIIQPGEVLRVWAGSSSGSGFKCGFGVNIWNNSENDPAVLYDSQGKEVSRH